MKTLTTPPTDPRRRSTRGGWMFLTILLSWVVSYFAARAVLERDGLSVPLRVAVALMPVVVLSIVLMLVVRALARADELERLIHLLAASIALPLIAATVLAIAMLQHARILKGGGGAGDIWPFITCFYLLGYVIARAHYRMDETDDAGADSSTDSGADATATTPSEAKP
jgi:hypothetical protein